MMSIFPVGSTGLRSKTDDVMRNIFGKTQHGAQATGSPTVLTGPRVPRHSSAWKDLLKFLKAEQGLRIVLRRLLALSSSCAACLGKVGGRTLGA